MKILEVESYVDTFGPKSRRKKPKLLCMDLEEMGKQLEEKDGKYDKTLDLTIDQGYKP